MSRNRTSEELCRCLMEGFSCFLIFGVVYEGFNSRYEELNRLPSLEVADFRIQNKLGKCTKRRSLRD